MLPRCGDPGVAGDLAAKMGYRKVDRAVLKRLENVMHDEFLGLQDWQPSMGGSDPVNMSCSARETVAVYGDTGLDEQKPAMKTPLTKRAMIRAV